MRTPFPVDTSQARRRPQVRYITPYHPNGPEGLGCHGQIGTLRVGIASIGKKGFPFRCFGMMDCRLGFTQKRTAHHDLACMLCSR